MEQFAERQKANSGLSTTSLVLGIISIVISIIPIVNYLIYLLAPIGLICGIIAIIQSQSLTKSIIGIISIPSSSASFISSKIIMSISSFNSCSFYFVER